MTRERTANLVHEFTCRVHIGPQHEIGDGPYGRRRFVPITGGSVEGPRFNGRLVGPGGDWMLVGPDGFMSMDVRIQIETDDGAIVCARYFGSAEVNERFSRAIETCEATGFADQAIRTGWVLECGARRYRWVNRTVFIGEGRLQPVDSDELGFEHRVYRLG